MPLLKRWALSQVQSDRSSRWIWLGDPDPGQDTTIFIELKTGMFGGDKRDLVTMRKVTYELARVVWRYFNGQYEVEVFIGDLDGETKTLIKPATGQRTLGV